MFLNKNYILANELVNQMDINIANISILKKQFEDDGDDITIVKLNNCSFIKTNSFKLPNNIKEGICKYKFTDISNKIPCSYFREEYEISDKEIMSTPIITGKVTIDGKKFYEFDNDFVRKVKNHVLYTLTEEEKNDCYSKGQIAGFIKISKNKYLTWYPKYS